MTSWPRRINVIRRRACVGLLLGLLGGGGRVVAEEPAAVYPVQLRCEYKTNPVIDVPAPRLSWRLQSSRPAQRQTAFHILVASSVELLTEEGADLWNTGRVATNATTQIAYAGQALASRSVCFWKVRVWDGAGRSSAWSEPAHWEMGLLDPVDWQASWIGLDLQEKANSIERLNRTLVLPPVALFRRNFEVDAEKELREARLYITALGLYRTEINGNPVGDYRLAPGWSDYDQRVYYQVYDVKRLLRTGTNAVGVALSHGWYSGYVGLSLAYLPHRPRGLYGEIPQLRAQLELTYTDDSRTVVASDGSWLAKDGPDRESDILMGVTYDARLREPGWTTADYDASTWSEPKEMDGTPGTLLLHPAEPVRVTETLSPTYIETAGPSSYLVDFGQNLAGVVRLHMQGEAGANVVIRYGEAVHSDGRLATENLRHARATDTYILRGDERGETWTPRFTYHGFRYAEVSGYHGVLTEEDIAALVMETPTTPAGGFHCDNAMVNKLYENIVWSQRANSMDIPTDCPQRDERLGWTGDALLFVRSAAKNRDVATFFTKWLYDCNDAQLESGAFPDFAPFPFPPVATMSFSPVWMDAGIICPYEIFRAYNDTRLIRQCYPHMRRQMEFHLARTGDAYCYGADAFSYLQPRGGFGDWLAPGPATPPHMLSTFYFAYSARLMADMAAAIGKAEDARVYADLAEKVKQAIQREFVDKDGRLLGDTQTAYATAIYLGVLTPEAEARAGEHLARKVEEAGGKLDTGFVGTEALLPALCHAGRADLAYRVLLNRTYPGWGYQVAGGATTLWERWDGYDRKKGFKDLQNTSFNHYALGSVCEWLFEYMAGIQPVTPGYQTFRVKPQIGDRSIKQVSAHQETMHGTIRSEWEIDRDEFVLHVDVPVNTEATVYVPASSLEQAQRRDGLTPVLPGAWQDGYALFKVPSGRYAFTSRLGPLRDRNQLHRPQAEAAPTARKGSER